MDKLIVKRGKIFQAGVYKDKKFSITPQELKEITVKNFTSPVPLDLTHKTTLKRLDSKLGQLVGIEADDAGQLFGVVEMPEWLHNVVCLDDKGNDIELGVSCSFYPEGHPQAKKLKKLALTDTPRVEDAAIFAAFSAAHPDETVEDENVDLSGSDDEVTVGDGEIKTVEAPVVETAKSLFSDFAKKHNTPEGQNVLQEMHNFSARFGAVCEKPAEFHAAHELKGLQAMHDVSVEHGATCNVQFTPENFTTAEESDGKETDDMEKEKFKILTTVLELIGKKDATFGKEEEDALKLEVERNEDGTPKDKSIEERDAPIGEPKVEEDKDKDKDFSAENETLKAQLAEANSQLEAVNTRATALVEAQIVSQSKEFANAVIAGGGALPANRVPLEAAFAQAIRDDISNTVEVVFGEGEAKGSRVDALKALYNVKTVDLSSELLDPEKTKTLLSDDEPDKAAVSAQAVKDRAKKLAEQINNRIKR